MLRSVETASPLPSAWSATVAVLPKYWNTPAGSRSSWSMVIRSSSALMFPVSSSALTTTKWSS